MKHEISNWPRILAPRPTVIISTVNKKGVSNAAPFSFVMPVSIKPPLIAFGSAPKRHTLKNIRDVGDFVVNIPSADLIKQTWQTAAPLPEGVSEIADSKLTEVKSDKIKSPKIKECFAKLECKFYSEYVAGDHIVVVGEVVAVDIDESVLNKDNEFDPKKGSLLMHVSGADFAKVGDLIKAGE